MTTHPPTSKSLRIQGTHTVPTIQAPSPIHQAGGVLAAFKHHANKSEPGHVSHAAMETYTHSFRKDGMIIIILQTSRLEGPKVKNVYI